MEKYISIFVDGASRNNPGPAGAGVYITHGDTVLYKHGFFLGSKTNNQAEYLALLLALFVVDEIIKVDAPLHIFSDSELLVRQMIGNYRVKNEKIAEIKYIIDPMLARKKYTLSHVVREKNKIADKLANEGINKKTTLPPKFITFLQRHEFTI